MRHVLWVTSVLGCLACGESTVDATKFEQAGAAASALRADTASSGIEGSAQFDELLKQFRAALSALEERTSGRREDAVLEAYRRAYENYGHFRRFKVLEHDAVGGMVLLRAGNRPIASRYELPMENRGGGRWVNRKDAMKVFSDQAEREMTTAAGLLSAR
jgi:hypothetical protein